eukprot:363824-Chlamydomonas_euryale.AAC.15
MPRTKRGGARRVLIGITLPEEVKHCERRVSAVHQVPELHQQARTSGPAAGLPVAGGTHAKAGAGGALDACQDDGTKQVGCIQTRGIIAWNRVALNGERYPPFTVHPVTGRRRGLRRPAAPTLVDLSHTLVEPPTRPKTNLVGLKALQQSTHPQASASRALPMSRRK